MSNKKEEMLRQTFLKGSLPRNLNGFYKGKLAQFIPGNISEFLRGIIANFWLPWHGKTFYNQQNRGDNILPSYIKPFIRLRFGDKPITQEEGTIIHVFPFKTAIKRSIKDNLKILQLNYNLPQNPPQIRNVVDELVCIGKDDYLGKAYIKEGKGVRLVAFFSLEK